VVYTVVLMTEQNYWDRIYREKAPDAMSWYAPHLEISLKLIEAAAPARSASIVDVGGGESTLVDDLLHREYTDVTVLDISREAVEVTKKRLGVASEQVRWIVGSITEVDLESKTYDVWHDRAAFHFLTDRQARVKYVQQVARAVKPGGHVIVGTFGPQGPERCSGLDVMRYDAESLHGEFGIKFRLVESRSEEHTTPWDTTQQFLYCLCRVD
jgi:SAM-dependent methyltransferase